MGISTPRDLDALHPSLVRWVQRWEPRARDVRMAPLQRPATGLSSESIFAEVQWSLESGPAAPRLHHSWVLRLPPDGEGLFPTYDVAAQGRLQAVLADAGVPAVAPLAVEDDPRWLGAPFIVMPRVAGRVVQAEQPYLRTGWLAQSPPAGQAHLHDQLIAALATIHRLDWVALGCGEILSSSAGAGGADGTGGGGVLAAQLERWARYLAWAGDGDVPDALDDGLRWCRAHLPVDEPPPSLLWGDVQLGNVLVAEDMGLAAVLDFEMADIGPAEIDLAWLLVLHDMAVERCGGDLPGFPGRQATLATYQQLLGRPLGDLRWYEVFAALRSGAILVRAARLLARLGVDDSWLTHHNPTIAVLTRLTGA
jgi:aminoglycoside phosphotransferase (APT) family kinase protein